jgi:anti-sigma28 factor (negative regulator of flagellin synthesis)
MNTAKLKEQIEKGEYEVDPAAVADAMLRRLHRLG